MTGCDNPTCYCCYPPEHDCHGPIEDGKPVGQEWTCPECGQRWRSVEIHDHMGDLARFIKAPYPTYGWAEARDK